MKRRRSSDYSTMLLALHEARNAHERAVAQIDVLVERLERGARADALNVAAGAKAASRPLGGARPAAPPSRSRKPRR